MRGHMVSSQQHELPGRRQIGDMLLHVPQGTCCCMSQHPQGPTRLGNPARDRAAGEQEPPKENTWKTRM